MSAQLPLEADVRAPFITDDDFSACMDRFAPFEAAPHLAVAVSGGGDSMALVLLAAVWARRLGGRITALTVDHGLRRESAEEAHHVAAWMALHGIDHEILAWTGPWPSAGIQEAARVARYTLLEAWCRRAGVIHLLVAHTLDDQAETVLLRLGQGSGSDGLAGMAAAIERSDIRLLRPLLAAKREDLRATLQHLGQAWIEDPSNHNGTFARARIRRDIPSLAASGVTPQTLAVAAAGLGAARRTLETATASTLARHARLHPAGFILLDLEGWAKEDDEIARRILLRCLMVVGGNCFAPRRDRLDRLHDALREAAPVGRAATLAGCRLLPYRGSLLICRETRGGEAPIRIVRNDRLIWDRRFVVTPSNLPDENWIEIGALGCAGWQELIAASPEIKKFPLPSQVRPTLPALRDEGGIVAVPHLNFVRADSPDWSKWCGDIRFRPANSLSGMVFSRFEDDALLLI